MGEDGLCQDPSADLSSVSSSEGRRQCYDQELSHYCVAGEEDGSKNTTRENGRSMESVGMWSPDKFLGNFLAGPMEKCNVQPNLDSVQDWH